jgi:hypothetical protein
MRREVPRETSLRGMRAPATRGTAPSVIPLRQVVERERLARRAHLPREASSLSQMTQGVRSNVYGQLDGSTPMIHGTCHIESKMLHRREYCLELREKLAQRILPASRGVCRRTHGQSIQPGLLMRVRHHLR